MLRTIERHRPTIDRVLGVLWVQVLTTGLTGVTGLLIVNELPKEQYAMYTFLVAASSLLVGITDLGLVYCAMPIVGSRADDRAWVVAVCRRIYQKRWILFSIGIPAVSVYAIVSMSRHGWTHWWFLLALAATAALSWSMLSMQFTGEILAITQSIRVLNRAGRRVALIRSGLILVALLPWWGHLRLSLLFVAGIVGTGVGLAIHRRHIRGFGVPTAVPIEERRQIDRRILEIVRPLVVPGLYYQVQGLVTVLLATLAGSAAVVADIGALGRLVMLLLVVDAVVGTLLLPRLARCTEPREFDRLTLVGVGVYGSICVLATLSAVVLPQVWLLLLGSQYASNAGVLWMAVLAGTIGSLTGFVFRVLLSRGFSQGQTLAVLVPLSAQVVAVVGLGASSTAQILAVSLANVTGQLVVQVIQLTRLRRRAEAIA